MRISSATVRILSQRAYAQFDAPGAVVTRTTVNNAVGAVTGWYFDANNLNHGFIWQPCGEAASLGACH